MIQPLSPSPPARAPCTVGSLCTAYRATAIPYRTCHRVCICFYPKRETRVIRFQREPWAFTMAVRHQAFRRLLRRACLRSQLLSISSSASRRCIHVTITSFFSWFWGVVTKVWYSNAVLDVARPRDRLATECKRSTSSSCGMQKVRTQWGFDCVSYSVNIRIEWSVHYVCLMECGSLKRGRRTSKVHSAGSALRRGAAVSPAGPAECMPRPGGGGAGKERRGERRGYGLCKAPKWAVLFSAASRQLSEQCATNKEKKEKKNIYQYSISQGSSPF